jgi:hypothetical protein
MLRDSIGLPFLTDAGGTNRPKGSWQEAGQIECGIESNDIAPNVDWRPKTSSGEVFSFSSTPCLKDELS